MGLHVLDTGRPRRSRGEPVKRGLDGLGRSPEAVRHVTGKRLGVVEKDLTGDSHGMADGRPRGRVVDAGELTLCRTFAEAVLGLARRRRLHRLASRHFDGHRAVVVHRHRLLHRTFARHASGCQPAQGQHRAQQQDENGPKNFHGNDCRQPILSCLRFILSGSGGLSARPTTIAPRSCACHRRQVDCATVGPAPSRRAAPVPDTNANSNSRRLLVRFPYAQFTDSVTPNGITQFAASTVKWLPGRSGIENHLADLLPPPCRATGLK